MLHGLGVLGVLDWMQNVGQQTRGTMDATCATTKLVRLLDSLQVASMCCFMLKRGATQLILHASAVSCGSRHEAVRGKELERIHCRLSSTFRFIHLLHPPIALSFRQFFSLLHQLLVVKQPYIPLRTEPLDTLGTVPEG
jgi:hypothetical protein